MLHISDCGDEVEKVSEVTTSHVKLSKPVFSATGLMIKDVLRAKVKCYVLIYQINKAYLTLHVYLIPRDPGLKKVLKYLAVTSISHNKIQNYTTNKFINAHHKQSLLLLPCFLSYRN